MPQWFWPQFTSLTSTRVRLARSLHVAFYALGALFIGIALFVGKKEFSSYRPDFGGAFGAILLAMIAAAIGRGIRYVWANE